MLHRVIATHLDAFLCAAAEAGEGNGLPQFIKREFRDFLTCGALLDLDERADRLVALVVGSRHPDGAMNRRLAIRHNAA